MGFALMIHLQLECNAVGTIIIIFLIVRHIIMILSMFVFIHMRWLCCQFKIVLGKNTFVFTSMYNNVLSIYTFLVSALLLFSRVTITQVQSKYTCYNSDTPPHHILAPPDYPSWQQPSPEYPTLPKTTPPTPNHPIQSHHHISPNREYLGTFSEYLLPTLLYVI